MLKKLCLSPLLLMMALSGCSPVTYSGDKLKEAIADIAKKEYGIEQCEVEMNGTTLGVFLPLTQLFVMDFKEALMSGKVTNMDELFEPTKEAIDKVESMLFSMSRVMLSTDKKIEFYYLQATDVEKTGMELSFLGNIDDIKRVRYWDIPRSEYRKRVIHNIQLNRASIWDRSVRHFFRDVGGRGKTREEIQAAYFKHTAESKWVKEFYFVDPAGRVTDRGQAKWEILLMKSLPLQDNEVIVYAKVRVVPWDMVGRTETLEYLFQVSNQGEKEQIRRIIPMRYMEEIAESSTIPLTKSLIYKSLEQWDSGFKTPDVTMGEFLSLQLTRRIQQIVAQDERIRNTFTGVRAIFKYEDKDPEHFSFFLTASPKNAKQKLYSEDGGIYEDVMYLWELAAREFVGVVRDYGFRDWQYLEFGLAQIRGFIWKTSREDLELFRKKKKGLQDVLSVTAVSPAKEVPPGTNPEETAVPSPGDQPTD